MYKLKLIQNRFNFLILYLEWQLITLFGSSVTILYTIETAIIVPVGKVFIWGTVLLAILLLLVWLFYLRSQVSTKSKLFFTLTTFAILMAGLFITLYSMFEILWFLIIV